MSAMWFVYLASVAGGLNCVFSILGWLSVVVLAITIFVGFMFGLNDPSKEEIRQIKKAAKMGICSLLLFGTLSAVIPPEKTIYLMAGAKVTEDIVKSPGAKEIGDKILKVINQKLDEQVTDKK